MKIGLLIPYYHIGPKALALLRLLVESIQEHLAGRYDVLLVVDDCSPEAPEWLAYQASVTARDPRAVFYRLADPRPSYYFRGDPKRDPEPAVKCSFGHAPVLMAGFHKLRQLGCTHAWVMDPDALFLDGGWVDEALRLLRYDRAAVVTDYYGGRPRPGFDLVADTFHEHVIDPATGRTVESIPKHRKTCLTPTDKFGFANLFCALVDLAVEERFGVLRNSGWVNGAWGWRLWDLGYRVAFFPFFQGSHAYHFGCGFRPKYLTFGNMHGVNYGGKGHGIYHAGYLQLNRGQPEVERFLDTVASAPLDRPAPRLPREWLSAPDPISPKGSPDLLLRPFEDRDLDALRECDDAETRRHLPGWPSPEEILAAGKAAPKRWLALCDAREGFALVGYVRIVDGPASDEASIAPVVRPSRRRRGFGRALLEQFMNHSLLLCSSVRRFLVHVGPENTAGLALLRSPGGRPWVQQAGSQAFECAPPFPDPPVPSTREEARRNRERLLFDGMGIRP